MGGLIALNLAWAILSLPWVLSAGLLLPAAAFWADREHPAAGIALGGLAVCIGLISPCTLALIEAVGDEDGGIRDRVRRLLGGVGRQFRSGQVLGLLMAGVVGLLAINAGFYARLKGPAGWALAGLVLWTGAGLLVIAPLWMAASASSGRAFKSFGTAVHLTAMRPFLCVGALGVAGGVLLCGAATVAGIFLGAISIAALWAKLVFEALSAARDGRQVDLSESRSLRELWRPWEERGRGA